MAECGSTSSQKARLRLVCFTESQEGLVIPVDQKSLNSEALCSSPPRPDRTTQTSRERVETLERFSRMRKQFSRQKAQDTSKRSLFKQGRLSSQPPLESDNVGKFQVSRRTSYSSPCDCKESARRRAGSSNRWCRDVLHLSFRCFPLWLCHICGTLSE